MGGMCMMMVKSGLVWQKPYCRAIFLQLKNFLKKAGRGVAVSQRAFAGWMSKWMGG